MSSEAWDVLIERNSSLTTQESQEQLSEPTASHDATNRILRQQRQDEQLRQASIAQDMQADYTTSPPSRPEHNQRNGHHIIPLLPNHQTHHLPLRPSNKLAQQQSSLAKQPSINKPSIDKPSINKPSINKPSSIPTQQIDPATNPAQPTASTQPASQSPPHQEERPITQLHHVSSTFNIQFQI